MWEWSCAHSSDRITRSSISTWKPSGQDDYIVIMPLFCFVRSLSTSISLSFFRIILDHLTNFYVKLKNSSPRTWGDSSRVMSTDCFSRRPGFSSHMAAHKCLNSSFLGSNAFCGHQMCKWCADILLIGKIPIHIKYISKIYISYFTVMLDLGHCLEMTKLWVQGACVPEGFAEQNLHLVLAFLSLDIYLKQKWSFVLIHWHFRFCYRPLTSLWLISTLLKYITHVSLDHTPNILFFLSIHLAWNRPKKQAPILQPKSMNKATEPQEETISNCEDFHSKKSNAWICPPNFICCKYYP